MAKGMWRPRPPVEGERARILGWICLLIAVNQLGFGSIVPVVPLYADRFGVTSAAVGGAIAVYGLARFLLNVPAGRLADGRGRRWTLALGGLITVIGNLGCGLAPNYDLFLVARFVAGAGAAMVLTGGQIVVADIASPHNRGRLMGLYQGVFLFAVGAGPVPGGILATQIDLRAPFFANAAMAAVVALLAWFRVPETRDYREFGSSSTAPASGRSLLARLQALTVSRGFLLISLVSFSAFFARTGALFNVVPLLAENRMGLRPDQIGLGLGMISLVGLFLAYPSGWLVDHFGRKAVIVPSTVLSGVSLLLFATTATYPWFLVASLVWAINSGMSGAAPAAYAADVAPPGQQARALGSYRMLADAGYVVGPLSLGVLSDVGGPILSLAVCAALLTTTGLIFALFAPETHPRRAAAQVTPSGAEPTGQSSETKSPQVREDRV